MSWQIYKVSQYSDRLESRTEHQWNSTFGRPDQLRLLALKWSLFHGNQRIHVRSQNCKRSWKFLYSRGLKRSRSLCTSWSISRVGGDLGQTCELRSPLYHHALVYERTRNHVSSLNRKKKPVKTPITYTLCRLGTKCCGVILKRVVALKVF